MRVMMPIPAASTQLLCQQCAAPLPVKQGSSYTTCEYCGTVNYLDKSQAVLHYAMQPTLDGSGTLTALRRWMAGNDTVKNLDTLAHIAEPEYELFPVWLVRAIDEGKERVFFKPAAAMFSAELDRLSVPASSLVAYDPSMDAAAVQPTVPLTALRAWLKENERLSAGAVRETSLLHLPFYVYRYDYDGDSYTARVNAANGQVIATFFPRKEETPYLAVGGLGCLAYFAAALIPGVAYLIAGGSGLAIGMLIYLVVAVALAIPLLGAAARTSQRY